MKLTSDRYGPMETVFHVDPSRITAAKDDTREVFVDGIGKLRLSKKSYEKAVGWLDREEKR